MDGSALRFLVAKVLPDDRAALGQELVTLVTGERGDLLSAWQLEQLKELLSEAKVDWQEQQLVAQRLELLTQVEKLSKELSKRPSEALEALERRVQISAELLGGLRRAKALCSAGKYDVGGPKTAHCALFHELFRAPRSFRPAWSRLGGWI